MSHRLLIADDSSTIQKVVRISLSEESFDLDFASSEAELFEKIEGEDYSLILLDFGLSDELSGYELAKKIKGPKIILFFGTFDSIDNQLLESSGSSASLSKPFDSANLLNLIHKVLGDSSTPQYAGGTVIVESQEDNNVHEETEANWEVEDNSDEEEVIEQGPADDEGQVSLDPVEEIQAWEMSVPESISGDGDQVKMVEKPPILGDSTEEETITSFSEVENILSEEESLDSNVIEGHADEDLTSKLIPRSDLNLNNSPKEEVLETSDEGVIPMAESNEKTDLNTDLESEIENEIGQEFWKADEGDSDNEDTFTLEESTPLEETLELEDDTSGPEAREEEGESEEEVRLESPLQAAGPAKGLIPEDLEEKIREKMKPIVEEYVRELCQTTLEKVAWEVMPDLAENLIKKELEKISQNIMD